MYIAESTFQVRLEDGNLLVHVGDEFPDDHEVVRVASGLLRQVSVDRKPAVKRRT